MDGYPTGSIRVSFGYMSTLEDAQKFVRFIEQSFVGKKTPKEQSAELKKPTIASQPLVPHTYPPLEESLDSAREKLDSKPATQDITSSLKRQEPKAVSLFPVEGTGSMSCGCTCTTCEWPHALVQSG